MPHQNKHIIGRSRPTLLLVFGASLLILGGTALLLRRWKVFSSRHTELPVAAVPEPPQKGQTGQAEQVQTIGDGRGRLYKRIYQVDIADPKLTKTELFKRITDDINRFTPQEIAHFEKTKGADETWQVGDEFLVRITGPWNGPVRLTILQPDTFTFVTLSGHLEAGQIQFSLMDHPDEKNTFRFEIRSWARSSNPITNLLYQLGLSKFPQTRMWTFFCDKVVEESGGTRLGKINVMTHHTPYGEQTQPKAAWERYSQQFDRWSHAALNYDPSKRESFTEIQGWNIDHYMIGLPSEPSGEPIRNGSWEAAKAIISNYEFPDPGLISGIFVPDKPLHERIMIVRGRFLFFTFLFGVRVSQVIDEVRATEKRGQTRVWGYSYRTLEGHFEMGEITFEVWKFLESGEIEFHISAYSKPAAIRNPFYRLGFRLFGRSLQRRFGATSLERMQQLVIERTAHQPTSEEAIESPPVRTISSSPEAQDKVEAIQSGPEQADNGL